MPLVPSPRPSMFGAASVRMSVSIDVVSLTSSAKAVAQATSSRRVDRFMRAIVTLAGGESHFAPSESHFAPSGSPALHRSFDNPFPHLPIRGVRAEPDPRLPRLLLLWPGPRR